MEVNTPPQLGESKHNTSGGVLLWLYLSSEHVWWKLWCRFHRQMDALLSEASRVSYKKTQWSGASLERCVHTKYPVVHLRDCTHIFFVHSIRPGMLKSWYLTINHNSECNMKETIHSNGFVWTLCVDHSRPPGASLRLNLWSIGAFVHVQPSVEVLMQAWSTPVT